MLFPLLPSSNRNLNYRVRLPHKLQQGCCSVTMLFEWHYRQELVFLSATFLPVLPIIYNNRPMQHKPAHNCCHVQAPFYNFRSPVYNSVKFFGSKSAGRLNKIHMPGYSLQVMQPVSSGLGESVQFLWLRQFYVLLRCAGQECPSVSDRIFHSTYVCLFCHQSVVRLCVPYHYPE